MSDATKMVTVTCTFGVEVPVELDLDGGKGYNRAVNIAAEEIHQRGFGEMKKAITDIFTSEVVTCEEC